MLTAYGKVLRKLRIDRQELLKDMADRLGVSSAYLSAVETGKRRIPASWTSEIAKVYKLGETEIHELEAAEEASILEVRIPLDNASETKRSAVLTFAKTLNGLSDEDLKRIMSTMKGKGCDGRHA